MLSPLDDRYADKVSQLNAYFSEDAQLVLKAEIEISYFEALCHELEITLSPIEKEYVKEVSTTLHPAAIKLREEKTKHDIKAIEYYLQHRFTNFNIPNIQLLHFGLTSQDINSVALSSTLHKFNQTYFLPLLDSLLNKLESFGNDNDCIFPARTHGQLAVPTSFKKEIDVFISRLNKTVSSIRGQVFEAKFGGAVGNLSAHYIAYPQHNWHEFADNFVSQYGLVREQLTTQVSNNTTLCSYFDQVRMINNILIGLCRDIWMYNSYGYFKQAVTEEEVGSSTMPQKINPINFENGEGNLELANCLLEFMSNKLQISRMQRDLTDTTISRNMGVVFGHCVLAYKSILEGLNKLSVNRVEVDKELQNSGLLAEAYQIILKKEDVKDGYEIIKSMNRNGANVDQLNISENLKEKLKKVKVEDYCSQIKT